LGFALHLTAEYREKQKAFLTTENTEHTEGRVEATAMVFKYH